MASYVVQPLARPPDVELTLPGSKSFTNRALLIAALAEGRSTVREALLSDDTRHMANALRALGFAVDLDEARREFVVEGQGGRIPAPGAALDVGNAGTAARFLTAALSLGSGRYVLDGSTRMRQRPAQPPQREDAGNPEQRDDDQAIDEGPPRLGRVHDKRKIDRRRISRSHSTPAHQAHINQRLAHPAQQQ